ncbi:MAG TPA: hypothetical protein EYQ50_28775 [Verrucomicrobiales bacterium]|nr:hypothetical protein [Verrucomicrobiales bacterium]HIL72170.1 hypothetical protein [Verrucomicrobiota bacterium]
MTIETFEPEIAKALDVYQKYIVCIDKTPDQFRSSIESLMEKAIRAYQGRGSDLRHGIALDRQLTIILSQNEQPKPLCGIYFNLHTPYQTPKEPGKKVKKAKG